MITTSNKFKFNPIITLSVIESDIDLTEIFREDVSVPFPELRALATDGDLPTEIMDRIEAIFDKLILIKQIYIERYKRFGGEMIKPQLESTLPVNEVKVVIKPSKIKKESVIPRRYGKEQILKDVEKNGGKPSELQRAMLRINDLKNIYSVLSARGIKDTFSDVKTLTNEDCRNIVATIETVEKKLDTILNKRR